MVIFNTSYLFTKTYLKEDEFLTNKTRITACETIETQSKEEIKLLIKSGDINEDYSIPLMTIVTDGA